MAAKEQAQPQGQRAGEPAAGETRPLLMVDIDGVISLFAGTGEPPWASRQDDPQGARAGSFYAIEGVPHYLSHGAAAHLRELAGEFDLVWCSGWEEKADEHLPRLLELPAGLPHLRFERAPGRANAHWKLAAIEAHAGSRALAWIDDAFNDACHAWAAARAAPTLLVQTAPERGLTYREAQVLAAWGRELRRG